MIFNHKCMDSKGIYTDILHSNYIISEGYITMKVGIVKIIDISMGE